MVAMSEAGEAAEVPGGRPYAGPLPGATVRGLRKALCEALAGAGLSRQHIGQVVGMAEATVGRTLAEAGPEPDASLPRDDPPGIDPPVPYRRPAFVEVSARLIAELKADYPRGSEIGDRADVERWLEGLKPGRFLP